MSALLYTKEDNKELNSNIVVAANTQALINSTEQLPDATVSTSIPEGLPTNIHQVLEQLNASRMNLKYFTHTKGKVKFDIDKTILEPSITTSLAGKKFDEAYKKQLNSIVYTSEEELNVMSLSQLVSVYQIIDKGFYPINITSAKHKRKIIPIIVALNEFFNKNQQVISGIYRMMSAQSVVPSPKP